MNTYVGIEQTDVDGRLFGAPRLSNGNEIPLITFRSCQKFEGQELVVPTIQPGKILKASLIHNSIPVFDEAGVSVIKDLVGDDIQFIPSITEDGIRVWVGNLLVMRDCIDRSRSKAEYYPHNYPIQHLRNRVKTAFMLMLNESAIGDCQIFRIKDDPIPIVGKMEFLELLNSLLIGCFQAGQFPRYEVG